MALLNIYINYLIIYILNNLDCHNEDHNVHDEDHKNKKKIKIFNLMLKI